MVLYSQISALSSPRGLCLLLLLYGLALWCQWCVWHLRCMPVYGLLMSSVLAVGWHAVLLYHWVGSGVTPNLSVSNLFALWCCAMALMLLLMAWRSYMLALGVLVYPLAMVSMVLAWCFPGQSWASVAQHGAVEWHMVLAIMVMAVLGLSALMTMMMAWQEYRIRDHHLSKLDGLLPSLMLVERHVFQMICVGFVVLSVMLAMSVYQYQSLLLSSDYVYLRYKVVLVLLAWLVFAGSLVGRWVVGYRGRQVMYMAWLGVGLLLLVYLGVEVLL